MEARRILLRHGDISRNEYYNLQRSAGTSGAKEGAGASEGAGGGKEDEKALLAVLAAEGFHYRLKRKRQYDKHGRKTTQPIVAAVFFTAPHLITLTKKFVSI